ncbi:uncharacterized protein B0P05DRAFT_543482 [Gilbertella persicaria]|uniref:uncharacterized protein n=1 Tax=Gilbertella persicaria TaxID=101096 RepID=UPI00221EC46F|nr:uncharacterized protein B0P05DRAFT_543482 [Gilbertella persicaria]KAI8077952.1 hypothetical protein B0P05DRAFT_543482 [Gilbertella persicaria]
MKFALFVYLIVSRLVTAAAIPNDRQYRLDVFDSRLCLSVGSCRYTCVTGFYNNTSATVPKYKPNICPDRNDYTMTLVYAKQNHSRMPDYLVNSFAARIPCAYGGKAEDGHDYYHCPPLLSVSKVLKISPVHLFKQQI